MRVFYDSQGYLALDQFGIEIPLTDTRISRIRAFLSEQGYEAFCIDDLGMELSLGSELLSLAHNSDYVAAVFGSISDVERTVYDTFELFDKDGNPHRYDPKKAKRPLIDLSKNALRQASGTLVASQWALQKGKGAFFLGGGFHHGMSFGGRGFCYVNDIVIAAKKILQEPKIKQIWVIDIDAHKGDGTAELCRNEERITTFSIHMAEGWPLDEPSSDEAPWLLPSDVDVPIGEGEDHIYNDRLRQGLELLETKNTPDFIFVIQGSDPYEKDQLPSSGKLKLSLEQMLERDLLVNNFVKKYKVPYVHLLSGGYGAYAHEPYINFFKNIIDQLD